MRLAIIGSRSCTPIDIEKELDLTLTLSSVVGLVLDTEDID